MIIENVIKADVCKNKSANAVGFSLIDDNVALHHLNKRQKKPHILLETKWLLHWLICCQDINKNWLFSTFIKWIWSTFRKAVWFIKAIFRKSRKLPLTLNRAKYGILRSLMTSHKKITKSHVFKHSENLRSINRYLGRIASIRRAFILGYFAIDNEVEF